MHLTEANNVATLNVGPDDPPWLAEFYWVARRRFERDVDGARSPSTDAYYDAVAASEVRAAFERLAKDTAKTELHPTYVPDDRVRQQVEAFWALLDGGVERDAAYTRATGSDVRHLSERFKEACHAFGRPWPVKSRGRRKGSKDKGPRKQRPVRGLPSQMI